jgi:hypothetical protein
MTSQIDTSTIDVLYPIAGQDNDSQGFRDNFNNIVGAITTAKNEITSLQSKALLSSDLENNTVVSNDLGGSSIKNGTFKQFYQEVYSDDSASGSSIDINLENGSFQSFIMQTNTTFTFRNWPGPNPADPTSSVEGIPYQLGTIRVLLSSNLAGTTREATFTSENNGTVKPGVNGLASNGWSMTAGSSPRPKINIPAQVARTVTNEVSPSNPVVLPLNNVQGIRPGLSVTFTPADATVRTATVSSVDVNTNRVTLQDILPEGSAAPTILNGSTITFNYASGACLIEAYSPDGGNTVYIDQISYY